MSSAPSSAARPVSTFAIAAALAAVYLIWGSTYLGIRWALEGGYPALLAVAGIRFLIAGSALYAVLRWRGMAAPTPQQWRALAVLGVLLMLVGNGFVVLAEQTVSSGLAAVAIASVSLWIGLFGTLFGQRSSRIEWLGIGVGFLGVLWLNAGSAMTATPTGLLLLLIAPVGWAFGSVWSRRLTLPSPLMSAAAQMICGGVALIATGLALGERFTAMPTLQGTLSLAYLITFGSIVAFSAYIWLLHNVRPVLATSYAYVNPPVAVLLGALLAGERFSAHDIGAMAVILVGVVIISLAKSRAPKPAVAATTEPAT